MYCSKCGTRVDNARFCPKCGTEQTGSLYPESSPNIKKPSNYLFLSIIVTIFCCIPFGIVSLIYSSKVDSLYSVGSYKEAKKASDKALMWSLLGIGIIVFVYFLYFLLVVLCGISLFNFGSDTFTL